MSKLLKKTPSFRMELNFEPPKVLKNICKDFAMGEKKLVALAGGPCSGKTSVTSELWRRSFSVMDEIARKTLERYGRSRNSQEVLDRQLFMFFYQLEEENLLLKNAGNSSRLIFVDRGLVDIIAYCQHLLGEVPKLISEISSDFKLRERYGEVFILERLPFKKDGVRIESGELEAKSLHELVERTYFDFGYNPIYVPVMPVSDRADFILNKLDVKGGGENGRLL